jgi:hypothetical protein
VGTPGDSRGQRVNIEPLVLLRFHHESRASQLFLENKGSGFDSRRSFARCARYGWQAILEMISALNKGEEARRMVPSVALAKEGFLM